MSNLTKEEFKIMVMLYASNIDGNVSNDEVDIMLEKSSPETFKSVKKMFNSMNDIEVLECINQNVGKYASSQEEKQQLIDSIHDVIMADSTCTSMENYLFNTLKKLLK